MRKVPSLHQEEHSHHQRLGVNAKMDCYHNPSLPFVSPKYVLVIIPQVSLSPVTNP